MVRVADKSKNSASSPFPVLDLPREVLERVLLHSLPDQIDPDHLPSDVLKPEVFATCKKACKVLRLTCVVFPKLSVLTSVLVANIAIFTVPDSTGRLQKLALDLKLSKHVKKVMFNVPFLPCPINGRLSGEDNLRNFSE